MDTFCNFLSCSDFTHLTHVTYFIPQKYIYLYIYLFSSDIFTALYRLKSLSSCKILLTTLVDCIFDGPLE